MRLLPCGRTGLLVEVDTLDAALDLYAALREQTPDGVVDLVPAARTVLVLLDPAATDPARVGQAVRGLTSGSGERTTGDLVEVPVVYDGADLQEVGALTGWGAAEVVARHTSAEWTVAFCGFSPGFGYLTCSEGSWAVPRRSTPRTKIPAGAVALAGEFSGVYPRESPGGWQLIGRTDLPVFDVDREPPALLVPGARVRFVDVGHPR